MSRIALAALLALIVAPLATAQGLAVSPDGKYVAIEKTIPRTTTGMRRHVDILDTACLASGKPREACAAVPGMDTTSIGPRLVWSSDSKIFVADASRAIISLDGAAAPKPPARNGMESRIVFDAASAITSRSTLVLSGGDDPPEPIYNGSGVVIGTVSGNGAVSNMTGQSIMTTTNAGIQFPGDPAPPKIQTIAPLSGDRFWYWNSVMGQHGLLMEFAPNAARELPLPSALQGPVTIVVDSATNEPVALIDALALHPLASTGDRLDWLANAIATLRRKDARLELEKISVSTGARTAVVRGRHTRFCSEDHLVIGDTETLISPPCPVNAAAPGYAASHVELPADLPLSATLYRSNRPRERNKGLLIQFHGGPFEDSFRGPPLNETFFDPDLDVLTVEYRGSSGMGEAYTAALKRPLADIASADVRTAVDWARAQPDYHGKLVGLWGDSWGGFAVHAILSRDTRGLDFVISDSGFVENSPEAIEAMCKVALGEWKRTLFEARRTDDGVCNVASSGIFGRQVTSKIPAFIFTGAKDEYVTPNKIEMLWVRDARRDGACISVATSASGGHTLVNWPDAARPELVSALDKWLAAVASRRPSRCDANIALP